ncbi:hypothetical protein GCM10007304_03060 [Rhodococcoides trifolii]|uniref:DUF4126 domain-containing protein n=1 Tax=Rhodococcoides trifolii TaxID=908250 RepID=A0A917FNB2_9NOCA|nr:hypothetical protein [Rhodococcus trifolii]GGF92606.1 hypothetical protein GCM10007304_03060 [Rhodococcus trifolii]
MTISPAVVSYAIGFASGLRSSMGIATYAVARYAGTDREQVAGGVAAVAVLGEAVVDKLPSTPSRMEFPGLGGRIAAGGAGAYALARRDGTDRVQAAVLGAAGSLAGSWGGSRYRAWASTKAPALAGALAEDVVAQSLTAWAYQAR